MNAGKGQESGTEKGLPWPCRAGYRIFYKGGLLETREHLNK